MFAESEPRQLHLPQISMVNGDSTMDTSMRLHYSQAPTESGEFRPKNPNPSKRASATVLELLSEAHVFQAILYRPLRPRSRKGYPDRVLVELETPLGSRT
jgi:hypothetical protein